MKNFDTIVVGTDFSPLSDVALAGALDLAHASGARHLHLVHVVDAAVNTSLPPYSMSQAQVGRVHSDSVKNAQARLDKLDFVATNYEITRRAIVGIAAEALSSEAERVGADVIVAASHGYDAVRRVLMGSVTSALIRNAHCPVLVVGEGRLCNVPFNTALASVDMSSVSREVLSNGVGCLAEGGKMHVLSLFEHPLLSGGAGTEILPRYISEQEIKAIQQEHEAAIGAEMETIPHEGIELDVQVMSKAPAAQVLLETAEILQPDFIVMGTSGHNAWYRMLLGSTATRVISEAKCPVLVVPHTEE